MTREEHIIYAKNLRTALNMANNFSAETMESLDAAIKALEQESVIDKIRAEIEEYKSTIDNAISEDELKIEGMKEAYANCLETIDKHKAESENP